jgi:hypothetical protein
MADYSDAYLSDKQYAERYSSTGYGRVAAMPPRAEVIEYTHTFTPTSTSVREVFYNQNTRRLTVAFLQGGEYSYDGCSIQRYRALKKAESTGKYIRLNFTGAGKTGAKHGENVVHREIKVQGGPEVTDLDSLKTEKLTAGEGDTFTVHFEFAGTSSVEVRALDTNAALELFNDYFTKSGLSVKATRMELHL